MNLKCLVGMHEWNGCKCSKCGKIRDEGHDWSKDCEKCSRCAKTRTDAHDWKGCKCSRCKSEKHNWDEYKCAQCGEMGYVKMIECMYNIGKRCDIVGFINHTKEEYIKQINEFSQEKDVIIFLGKRHNYLGSVINQMYNPPISDFDVRDLNQIADVIKKRGRRLGL